MMKITGLSHLFKWENLHNWWLTKYFFAPLYIMYIFYVFYVFNKLIFLKDLLYICYSLSQTFSLTVPIWWNDLPNSIRAAESLPIFKKRLKTHLFHLYLTL